MAGSWGKFSEGQGGLEGEGTLFQEGSLSLQGLSLSLQGLSSSLHLLRESLYLRGALGIQSRADANNRVGKGQILAGF